MGEISFINLSARFESQPPRKGIRNHTLVIALFIVCFDFVLFLHGFGTSNLMKILLLSFQNF